MISKIHSILSKPVAYLQTKISPRQFFVFSSIIVGFSSGLAAIVLKYFVHSIERFVSYYSLHLEEFLVFGLCPLIGILITVIYIRYVLKNEFKKGTAEIVYSIVKK
jgi:CIC family chloride channel protein